MGSANDRSDLLELFPIKLVGGFITVDQHAGCEGCRFCLSRRHELWSGVFEEDWHYDDLFDSPEQALGMLKSMRSFRQARVPVRFGHNTDSIYQWDFGAELYRGISEEHPFIFMTRNPVPGRHISLFNKQPNLLLKLTITPPSTDMNIDTDIDALIETIGCIPQENLYVLIGPISEDNYAEVPMIIDRLPSGTWVDIKPLTRSGIPGLEGIRSADQKIIDSLRDSAFDRGMIVTDYFGCIFRKRLNRPFYKVGEAPKYIQRSCKWCEQRDLCFRDRRRKPRLEDVHYHASSIGLELGEAKELGHRILHFKCSQPASRGDETFLSEMTGNRIHLSSVPSGSEGGSFSLTDDAVLRRWEDYAMLPVDELMPLAERALATWRSDTVPV